MKPLFPLAALVLSACAAGAAPPPGTAVIEVSGGSYLATTTIRVFAGDTVLVERWGRDENRTTPGQGRPGLFVELASILAAEGPAASAAARNSPPCPDYGAVSVTADPPIGGFSEVTAFCPDPAVDGLRDRLLGVIGPLD